MPLNGLKLSDIGIDDINCLIANQEREGLYLEYKEILPDFKVGSQKLEFLNDISAFANAAGGDIIYGIEDKRDNANLPTAIPIAIPGLPNINIDSIQRQIEGIASSVLQPALRGLQFQPITVSNGNQLLIIRIPRSWVRPHAVFNNWDCRVYVRTASGKNPISFKEIADMIIGSTTMIDRVRDFRNERIELLKHNDLTITPPPPVVMMQMIPADSFESSNRFSAQLLREMIRTNGCFPLGSSGFLKWRYNFDGVFDLDGRDETKLTGYVQYFRNGIIESANNQLFFQHEEKLMFNSSKLEIAIINSFKQYLDLQKILGIELPIYVLISLLHIQGALITWGTARHGQNPEPIDREDLIIPELIVENFQEDPATILRDAFDSIWNAADLPRSLNYDEQGNWIGQNLR